MVARVTVHRDGELDESLVTTVERAFLRLADRFETAVGVRDFDLVLSEGSAPGSLNIDMSGDGIVISRTIRPSEGVIEHALFELDEDLQGRGLSRHVLNATANIAERTGINRVVLEANLDVGGYAWLRKGVFPEDVEELIDAAGGGDLGREFRALVRNMSEEEVRRYVLTEDFRRFRPLFLDSFWSGEADLSDPITRVAFTRSASQAAEMINRQIGPPSTANEQILDGLVRRQTFLMRYAASQRNTAHGMLLETEDRVREIVLRYADDLDGLLISSRDAQRLLDQMTQEIADARDVAWDEIISTDLDEAVQLARTEAAALVSAIESPVPVSLGLQPLPASLLRNIARSTPFEGRTLREWLERTRNVDVETIVATAKTGIMQGDTPTQVARRVLGTRGLDFRDSVARRSRRNLEALYLTVTNGIANEVKQELYRANNDIIRTELYVATLDVRTTLICASNDGERFPVNTGPVPPLHFRCRSLRVPYINPNNFGNRPIKPTTDRMLLREFAELRGLGTITSRDQLPRGTRTAYNDFARRRVRELTGQVPATQNFETFLRNQSIEFQNEYLGVRKAEIFRQGNLSLDRFVTRDGYELTIDQLENLT